MGTESLTFWFRVQCSNLPYHGQVRQDYYRGRKQINTGRTWGGRGVDSGVAWGIVLGFRTLLSLVCGGGYVTEQKKLEVWLPATAKAKLVRQVLVQKGRGLFRCHSAPVSKTILVSLLSPEVLNRDREGRTLPPHICSSFQLVPCFGPTHSSFQLSLGSSCPFIPLAFVKLSVRTSPCPHLDQWGRFPSTPTDCLQ